MLPPKAAAAAIWTETNRHRLDERMKKPMKNMIFATALLLASPAFAHASECSTKEACDKLLRDAKDLPTNPGGLYNYQKRNVENFGHCVGCAVKDVFTPKDPPPKGN